MAETRNLYVPIANSGDAVEVNVDELPPAADRILDVLMPESAPLALFLQFAVEYLKRGRDEPFESILGVALSKEAQDVYDASHNPARAAILCTLGAYYTRRGVAARGKDEAAADRFLNQATQNLNQCDQLSQDNPATWVCKGLLILAKKGAVRAALEQFSFALSADSSDVPALVGTALCKYGLGKHKEALESFQAALRANPRCPASVRLGIGFCLARMRNHAAARQAFERVLDFGPEDRDSRVQALAALAALDLNERGDGAAAAVERAMGRLEEAYAADPECPQVLVRLADHFFYAGDYSRAIDLARRADGATRSRELKVEAAYQTARAFHAQNDYDRAFNYYVSATRLEPGHSLAQFGLGQLHLRRGEPKEALACLQVAERAHPDSVTVARVVGEAYVRCKEWKLARGVAKRARALAPEDPELALLAGAAAEATAPADAAEAYQDAARLLRRAGRPVPYHLWNNVGNLYAGVGRHELAENAYMLALGPGAAGLTSLRDAFVADWSPPDKITPESRGEIERGECAALRVVRPAGADGGAAGEEVEVPALGARQATAAYNLALMYEARSQVGRAAAVYKAVLRSHPQYVDAYLRLGGLEMRRHNYRHAAAWYRRAQLFDKRSVEAELLLGQHYTAMVDAAGDGSPDSLRLLKFAASHFDRAHQLDSKLRGRKAATAYARLGMAAAWHRQDNPDKASKAARDVLERDPTNVYAVNGLAVGMAALGCTAEAKEAFAQAREAAGESPGLWVNQAHATLRLGQRDGALKIYEHVLARFPDYRPVDVLTYVANVQFQRGDFLECKAALVRAVRLAPENLRLWLNISLAQEAYCVQVLQKPVEDRSFVEVTRAVRELGLAVRTFARLPSQARAGSAKMAARARRAREKDRPLAEGCTARAKELHELAQRAESHHQFCLSVMEKAKPHVDNAAAQERVAEERQRDAARAREEAKARARAVQEERRRAHEAAEAEKRREALAARDRLEQMRREWGEMEAAEAAAVEEAEAKKRRRRKKGRDDEEEEDEDERAGNGDEDEGAGDYKPGDTLDVERDAAEAEAEAARAALAAADEEEEVEDAGMGGGDGDDGDGDDDGDDKAQKRKRDDAADAGGEAAGDDDAAAAKSKDDDDDDEAPAKKRRVAVVADDEEEEEVPEDA